MSHSLYHALQIWLATAEFFYFIPVFIILGALLIKKNAPLTFVGYEFIIGSCTTYAGLVGYHVREIIVK